MSLYRWSPQLRRAQQGIRQSDFERFDLVPLKPSSKAGATEQQVDPYLRSATCPNVTLSLVIAHLIASAFDVRTQVERGVADVPLIKFSGRNTRIL
jgi:hypothetical protein